MADYKLKVTLIWERNYPENLRALLRDQYELYGGDPVTFTYIVENIGNRPFSGTIKDIQFEQKIGSGGVNWGWESREISNLQTGQKLEVFKENLIPYGEGLLTANLNIVSADRKSVEIEGRGSSNYQYFFYVYNRLLLQLLGK